MNKIYYNNNCLFKDIIHRKLLYSLYGNSTLKDTSYFKLFRFEEVLEPKNFILCFYINKSFISDKNIYYPNITNHLMSN